MKNEKLRQKKIARNKKKRTHHNKAYESRTACEWGQKRKLWEKEKAVAAANILFPGMGGVVK